MRDQQLASESSARDNSSPDIKPTFADKVEGLIVWSLALPTMCLGIGMFIWMGQLLIVQVLWWLKTSEWVSVPILSLVASGQTLREVPWPMWYVPKIGAPDVLLEGVTSVSDGWRGVGQILWWLLELPFGLLLAFAGIVLLIASKLMLLELTNSSKRRHGTR